MKNSLTIIALTLSIAVPALATIRTENCGAYGPTKGGIVVALDDENESRVLSVGYENMGIFFGMKVRGCGSLELVRNQVVCDGRIIGSHSPVEREMEDDMLSNTLRAKLILKESAYEVTGSCIPADRKPLTIKFN